ncbi:MAG: outer membrane beta-barrel protein [Terracidiphilus sp.]|nr:outer membrane beta-barrel protein [Terracidiphilus sp.]
MMIPHFHSLARRASFFVFTAACTSGLLFAESAATSSAPESSSSSSVVADFALPDGMGTGAAASHDDHRGTAPGWRSKAASNYALEFGGGFNAPHPDSTPYITWGGNFTVGAGYNFSKRFAMMAEYQFIDSKLPGKLIAETAAGCTTSDCVGAAGGNDHIWSLTLDPVVSLFPHSTHDIYITGGGGFYRKMTNFTYPEDGYYCDYYYGCYSYTSNQIVGHFSSNQGGVNIGLGYQRRLGGTYHESRMKFFAEARYLHLFSPAGIYQPNEYLSPVAVGAGTTLIPVTFGVRW